MKFLKHFLRSKTGVRPQQIIFEKENTINTYVTWEDKMEPRIKLDDSITPEEYQALDMSIGTNSIDLTKSKREDCGINITTAKSG